MEKSIFRFQFYFLFLLVIFISCKKEIPQADIDEKLIKDYITLNNLPATRTGSGLYYIITDTTSNIKATYGKTLTVRYTGNILYGEIFYTNMYSSTPRQFLLGHGQDIAGWDEGFSYLRKGEKAEFFVPSALAYGQSGYGSIPPNSVLHYVVELIDIQ